MENSNDNKSHLSTRRLKGDIIPYAVLAWFEISLILDCINKFELTSGMIFKSIVCVLLAFVANLVVHDVIKYRNSLNTAKLLIYLNMITGIAVIIASVILVAFIVVKLFMQYL